MRSFFTLVADAIRTLLAGRARHVAEPSSQERESSAPSNESDDTALGLVEDTSWSTEAIERDRIDPGLRLAVALLAEGAFEQLFRRTGIRVDADGTLARQRLPLFLELSGVERTVAHTVRALMTFGSNDFVLRIPPAHLNEAEANPNLTQVTGYLELGAAQLSPATVESYAATLRDKLAALMQEPGVRRVSLPSPLQPCFVDALADIDLPVDRQVRNTTVDGNGIVVGIIDDGCALAHRNFLVPGTTQSRIQYLWDRSRTDPSGGWSTPLGMNGAPDYDGLELTNAGIYDAINLPGHVNGDVIDEEAIYRYLRYDLDLASHGTHVMDIAAGNGTSLIGSEGVASAADIIFVQLPHGLLDQAGPLLEDHIRQGVEYIFARAAALGSARQLGGPMPAVVNISYGGNSGPHDGSSPLAAGIDQLLAGQTERAVVVSAGNGFEADCHAWRETMDLDARARLHWVVRPTDPTSNLLEIWYEHGARLELTLTPPHANTALKAVPWGSSFVIRRKKDNKAIGWIDHTGTNTGGQLNVIRILLAAALGEGSAAIGSVAQFAPLPSTTAPAPSGVWKVGLHNTGTIPVTFHAWIERDDLGRRGAARQQSRFAPGDADPRYTLVSLATGQHTIAVGAYNTGTDEVCRYSAAGPTQDGRHKPEICAPAEEDAAGRGILCASSRRAQPTRMNGTSASAPHVTGLIALMLQFNRDYQGAAMTVDDIRTALVDGATNAQTLGAPPLRVLRPNRHQAVDVHLPAGKRQVDHFNEVIGAGKINVRESLKLLP